MQCQDEEVMGQTRSSLSLEEYYGSDDFMARLQRTGKARFWMDQKWTQIAKIWIQIQI